MSTLSQAQYLETIQEVLYHQSINTPGELKSYVSDKTGIPIPYLIGKKKPADIVLARQIGMFGIRTRFNIPLKQVGNEFGGRDHGTVIHAVKQIENYLQCTGRAGLALFKKYQSYKPPVILDNNFQIPRDFRENYPSLTATIKGYQHSDITAIIDAVYKDEDLQTSTTGLESEDQLSLF